MLGPIQTEATSTLCIVGQEDMQMRCGNEYCHTSFAYLMSCHFAEEAFAQEGADYTAPSCAKNPSCAGDVLSFILGQLVLWCPGFCGCVALSQLFPCAGAGSSETYLDAKSLTPGSRDGSWPLSQC